MEQINQTLQLLQPNVSSSNLCVSLAQIASRIETSNWVIPDALLVTRREWFSRRISSDDFLDVAFCIGKSFSGVFTTSADIFVRRESPNSCSESLYSKEIIIWSQTVSKRMV
uniref:Uncharacterized protein n=1 Tax=Cucumis melo TaxID=3656 RepID=A0A9I9EH59_CUCME